MKKAEIKAEENQMIQVLEYRLLHSLPKWAELVQMAGSNEYLGMKWENGQYNDAEELAAAAVAKAYKLDLAMHTETYAGIRRIAEFMQMPYTKLLTFYTKHYILSGHQQNGNYVPFETLKNGR